MTRPPTLSLCLIARDEERFLGACLDSVRGVVDEMIVVDTGSRDATVEIARAAGARVVDFPWVDDFAAARNAALAAATGDWVLVLDADERLAGDAGAQIRSALSQPDLHCGLLPLHNATRLDAPPAAVLRGEHRDGEPILLPRLLRVDDALAWKGAVHESVGAWLTDGRTARTVPAPIVHYGYVEELQESRDKARRNRELLERVCEAEPEASVPRTYLAREWLRAGDPDRALHHSTLAWEALQAAWRGGGPRPSPIMTLNLHTWLLLSRGQLDAARAVLEAAARQGLQHPNLRMLRASAAQQDPATPPQELLAAVQGLQENLRQGGRTFVEEVNPGATSWGAATLLGDLLLRLDRAGEAEAAYRRALASSAAHRPALLGRAESLVRSGRARQGLQAAEPLLSGPEADAWYVAAAATAALGDRRTAASLLLQTRGRPWDRVARARRAAALLGQLTKG